jgi:adenine-specific DNA-methyltransferase
LTVNIFNKINHSGNVKKFIETIPNTRYYGSKKKLLPWMYDILKDLNFYTVLDVFGGTASVSLLFQYMGKKVTFNDILNSNTISANALLNSKFDKYLPSDIMSFFDNVKPLYGTISKHYENIFFTTDENMWLDGAISAIMKIEDKNLQDLYFYFIFQASLMKRPYNLFHRANLYMRTNKGINRSFGNAVTWNRSFTKTIEFLIQDYFSMEKYGIPAEILPPTDASKLNSGYDLVYIDPPYIQGAKKDTYWKKYHFLEGMVNYDQWERNIQTNLKTKQFGSNSVIDEWETPALFTKKLSLLIQQHKNSIVALSYVSNATPSEEKLLEIFSNYFEKVTIFYKYHSHAMAKSKKTEILIIGEPL